MEGRNLEGRKGGRKKSERNSVGKKKFGRKGGRKEGIWKKEMNLEGRKS